MPDLAMVFPASSEITTLTARPIPLAPSCSYVYIYSKHIHIYFMLPQHVFLLSYFHNNKSILLLLSIINTRNDIILYS